MKLRMGTRLHLMSLVTLAVVAGSSLPAWAQSTLEVPAPSNQSQPNFAPPPQPLAPPPMWAPPPGSEDSPTIQVLPPPQLWMPRTGPPQAVAPTPVPLPPRVEPPIAVAPLPAQASPALPAVFRGCWQARVSDLDWIRREPGARKVGYWTPKTYRLCYKRVGDAPFKLTFTETGVAHDDKIINPRGKVVPISTDGRAFATLRARLQFDEYSSGRDSSGPTFAVDETTKLDCKIHGDTMFVSADVYGTRDGEPWFRAHWSARFQHYPE